MTRITRALAIFLRFPQAGQVKSRLAASLGPREAARIYEKLARRTLGVAAEYKKLKPQLKIFIFFTPPEKEQQITKAFSGPWEFVAQQGAHLGERMDRAIQHCLSTGYDQVVLVGTDIADLGHSDFEEAFQALDQGFTVLNPASDGGFYLIAVARPCPSALAPREWGTADVFQRTRDLLLKLDFKVLAQRERRDIDRAEDVHYLSGQPFFHDRISVIIPTRKSIDSLLPLLKDLDARLWPDDEIIISRHKDSSSSARQIETSSRVRLVDSPLGRGLQLNHGAREANGNLLWFLHDDSILPDQFSYCIRKIAAASHYSLGCFLLGFQPTTPTMEIIAGWANLRTRCLGLPYGDQGLFCRSDVFNRVGGYQKRYLMEDVDFVRRTRKTGKLFLVNERLYTSPKRYLAEGILRASIRNHLTMLLYLMGVSERKLRSFYYR